jgi:sarcosine oxidase subunit delta
MLIPCPHCGTRPVEEFTFLGDAAPTRPTTNDPSSMETWYEYVYLRNNPRGPIEEYAHHSGGCRSWLVVSRNTETHEVFGAVTARDFTKAKGAKA